VVKGGREALALILCGLSLVWAWRTWADSPLPSPEAIRAETGPEIPAVGLDRLSKPRADAPAPLRDVFAWGRAGGLDTDPVPTPVIRLAPIPAPTPFQIATPLPDPTPTPWPLLNVVLTGVVDVPGGRKGASFVKDGEVVLVGPPGAILANAFRVLSVNATSAEIEELGSGRVRRLPLKTN
jgi:hypothetical protein